VCLVCPAAKAGIHTLISFDADHANITSVSDLCWTAPSTIAAADRSGNIALYDTNLLYQTQLFPE
jgi:hypothetical protein